MKRLQINLRDEIYEELARMSAERGLNMTEFVKHALGLEKWYHELKKKNETIAVGKDGNYREVIPIEF